MATTHVAVSTRALDKLRDMVQTVEDETLNHNDQDWELLADSMLTFLHDMTPKNDGDVTLVEANGFKGWQFDMTSLPTREQLWHRPMWQVDLCHAAMNVGFAAEQADNPDWYELEKDVWSGCEQYRPCEVHYPREQMEPLTQRNSRNELFNLSLY